MTNAPSEAQPPQPPPQAPPPPASAGNDANQMAMLAHLLGIFTWFIGALIIWLVKKDVKFVEEEAKEALNFQITVGIGWVAVSILAAVTCGVGAFLYPILWVVNLIFCIMGAMKAKDGIAYRYPFAIRLIK
jgi:hypothetical protein